MKRNSILIETPPSWKRYNLKPGDPLVTLTWPDKARLVRDFHRLMQENFGTANGYRLQEGWSMNSSAEALNISKGSVVFYIKLAEAIEKDPSIASIGRMSAALKYIYENEKNDEDFRR